MRLSALGDALAPSWSSRFLPKFEIVVLWGQEGLIFSNMLGLLGEECRSPCSAPETAPGSSGVALNPAQDRGYVSSSPTFY